MSHLSAGVSSLLWLQPLQPIRLDLVKVALDSRLERLVLQDGGRAEGAACELALASAHFVTSLQCVARQGRVRNGAYPDGEDERPEEAAEGPGRTGWNVLLQLWGGEAPSCGRGLRRFGVAVA